MTIGGLSEMKKNTLLFSSVLALSLFGCAPRGGSLPSASESTDSRPSGTIVDGIRVAYSRHGSYLLRAEVQIQNKVAKSVHFDEVVFSASPDSSGNSIAKAVDQEEGNNVIALTTGKDDKVTTTYYAKYLTVNGKTYTASVSEGKLFYKNGDEDYDVLAKGYTSQQDRAKLYHVLTTNYAFGSDKDGKEIEGLVAPIYSKASNSSTYWPSGVYGLGWKANIAKIEKALVGKDLSKVSSDYKKASDSAKSKTGFVDNVDTGATISSFKSYITTAASAFTGESRVVEQFGLDHNNCFSRTELVVGEDNKVVYANINETNQFLSRLAQRNSDTGNDAPIVRFHTDATDKAEEVNNYYSQFISVNGKVWTGTAKDKAANREYVTYSSGNDQDALKYYSSSAYLANEYYNAQFLNLISIVKDAKGSASSDKVTYGNRTATKAENGNNYWTTGHGAPEDKKPDNYATWWKWNVAAVETAFVGLDFTSLTKDSAVTSQTADADGHKYVSINGVKTGASRSETKSYVQFAHEAYAYLVK